MYNLKEKAALFFLGLLLVLASLLSVFLDVRAKDVCIDDLCPEPVSPVSPVSPVYLPIIIGEVE